MKLCKLFPITICLLFFTTINAQKWHKIFDPIADQRFCKVFENPDNTISILTRFSFTEHRFTKLNEEGEIIDEIDFTLPLTSFRPSDYISLGAGDFAVVCQTNFLNSNLVRVVKFNDAGLVYWSQNIDSNTFDLRPSTLSLQANGNISVTGIAELFVNSNDDQRILLAELNTNDGELVTGFLFDTPAQYSAGIRVNKLENGNYIFIEGENFENIINVYGPLSIRQYYALELAPDGEIVHRIKLGDWTSGDAYQNKLDILSPDSIVVVTNRDVFLLNADLEIVWSRRTDLRIQEVKVDKSKKVIAIIGLSFAPLDNKGPSVLVIDFSGNVVTSKTHITQPHVSSSVEAFGLDLSENGYILASVRRKESNLNFLDCFKTDQLGLINDYQVIDVYSTCDQYTIPTPSITIPINECGDDPSLSINSKVTSSDLICTFKTLSNRIQTLTRVVTDSCGTSDTIIQIIHYEEVEPSITCCDYSVISQNEDGATIQFEPVTVDASCRPYTLYHLDSFDMNENVFFPSGIHSINFLLVNETCFALDSINQSFTIEIAFIDEDGDGFEASVDCDDNNENVNPDQEEEIYNGLDDDCDPTTLDDDLDLDGFVLAEDCDDNNADINPDQEEEVYNGIDDDCDPTTLDDDLDEDGFVLAEDCDDNNVDINPDQEEEVYNGIDDDCDPTTLDDDLDEDGFVLAEDCDDNNENVNPDQEEEVYNGIDDDCDPTTLDDDLDEDGFVLAEDCDDNNADINPDQDEEVYNGIDDDCDPTTLDDDLDEDGFVLAEDCDDNNAEINTDAIEIPNNGIDEDCDGEDLILSIHEIGNASINIFPNPTSSYINLEVDGDLEFNAIIYDLNGKIMIRENNAERIFLNNLSCGTYLIEIRDVNSNARIIEKIIVMN